MTTFDKREEAFEKKFAIEEELKFKAEVWRNGLLGLWAAEKLGMSGEAAATYAREAVAGSFAAGGNNALVARIAGDLAGKGVTEEAIRAKMSELMTLAMVEVRKGA